MVVLRPLIAAAALGVAAARVSFVTIGDWGGAGVGEPWATDERAVAKQMGKTASDLDARFVINTGDNFYFCGARNITDEQFKVSFEDIFTSPSLSVPWYGVLGNHDYGYEPQSQIRYRSPNNDRWQMPSYYYSKRLHLEGPHYATFVFLDTNPCVADYRSENPANWDPCSGHDQWCNETSDGQCHFHDHIVAQDCKAQFAWFQRTLDTVSDEDWVIVVGHHEADQMDVEDFLAPIFTGKVSLYLNGHTHALKRYTINGRRDIDFFTSGAGGMVPTSDQEVCLGILCASAPKAERYHKDKIFYQKIAGFTAHTFAEDFSSLKTEVLDVTGKVLHSFVTAKQAKAKSSSVEVVV